MRMDLISKGRNGTDNGWIQFTHVRIPRSHMLMKYTKGNMNVMLMISLSFRTSQRTSLAATRLWCAYSRSSRHGGRFFQHVQESLDHCSTLCLCAKTIWRKRKRTRNQDYGLYHSSRTSYAFISSNSKPTFL